MRKVEIPQSKILDNFVDMPTVVLRQVPFVRIVQKPVEIPQLQFLDMPGVVQRQMAMVLTVRAPLEIHICRSWTLLLSCPLLYNRSPTTITVASTVFPTATVPITHCCSPSTRSPTSLS